MGFCVASDWEASRNKSPVCKYEFFLVWVPSDIWIIFATFLSCKINQPWRMPRLMSEIGLANFLWLPVAFIHCYQQGSSDALSHQNKPNAFCLSKNAFPTFKRHKNTDLSNMKWNFISSKKKTKMLGSHTADALPQEAPVWDAPATLADSPTLSHQTLCSPHFCITHLCLRVPGEGLCWQEVVLHCGSPGSEN